jgi:RHS repeat-associated protein
MHLTNFHFYNQKNYLYSKPVKGFRGCGVSYRFGFNGKELDNEGMGGGGSTYDYGYRIYNAQLGRFLSVDPLTKSFPWNSPYSYAENDVIRCIDLDGLEKWIINDVPQDNGDIFRFYDYDPNRKPLNKKDKNGNILEGDYNFLYKFDSKFKSISIDPIYNSTTDLAGMEEAKVRKGSYVIIHKVKSEKIKEKVNETVPEIQPTNPVVIPSKNNTIVTPPDNNTHHDDIVLPEITQVQPVVLPNVIVSSPNKKPDMELRNYILINSIVKLNANNMRLVRIDLFARNFNSPNEETRQFLIQQFKVPVILNVAPNKFLPVNTFNDKQSFIIEPAGVPRK